MTAWRARRATDLAARTNPASPSLLASDIVDRMAEYGITRVPVDYFHFGEFRYTRLEDALAQAEHQADRDGDMSAP
jgi:hypothetical protein